MNELSPSYPVDGAPFLGKGVLSIRAIGDDGLVMRLLPNEAMLNPSGVLHGGVHFTLADTATGVHSFYLGKRSLTVASSIEYLAPTTLSPLDAVAKLTRGGRRILFYNVKLMQAETLVATASFTYAVAADITAEDEPRLYAMREELRARAFGLEIKER